MKVLVINTGSSSLRYQLIDTANDTVLAKGLCERIGTQGPFLKHVVEKDEILIECDMGTHQQAIEKVLEVLIYTDPAPIKSLDEIDAVGHRIVHGGEYFSDAVMVNENVKKLIAECSILAPLHNPSHLMGINGCEELMPDTPQVVVFDTAFHQTMPPMAYMYAIPYEYYEKHKIRKYGFHGTSHRYVAQRASEMLGKPLNELKLITCHLGNGASVTAIKYGKSVDTSMGFTPLAGLVMGSRSGNIDPAIVSFLVEKEGLTASEVTDILNKKSGVLAISGISNDIRDIEKAADEGNERAQRAYDTFAYRVRQYIGQYSAALGGADSVVFTAGIGENSSRMRKLMITDLEFLGIEIDDEKNKVHGKEADISAEGARVKTLVIPTNEELMIAEDTERIVREYNKNQKQNVVNKSNCRGLHIKAGQY